MNSKLLICLSASIFLPFTAHAEIIHVHRGRWMLENDRRDPISAAASASAQQGGQLAPLLWIYPNQDPFRPGGSLQILAANFRYAASAHYSYAITVSYRNDIGTIAETVTAQYADIAAANGEIVLYERRIPKDRVSGQYEIITHIESAELNASQETKLTVRGALMSAVPPGPDLRIDTLSVATVLSASGLITKLKATRQFPVGQKMYAFTGVPIIDGSWSDLPTAISTDGTTLYLDPIGNLVLPVQSSPVSVAGQILLMTSDLSQAAISPSGSFMF